MTTSKKSFEAVQTAMEEIAAKRIENFVNSLDANFKTIGQTVAATTVDNFIRQAVSQPSPLGPRRQPSQSRQKVYHWNQNQPSRKT